MKLTPKQEKLFNAIVEPGEKEIYVQGSVQSGKTYVIALSIIKYAYDVHTYDPNTRYNGAIVGWDLDTLKGNIVDVLESFMKTEGKYKRGVQYELKFGGNDKYFEFYNMRFYFFGFNTKLSFNKILGKPLLFVWIDESARIYSNSRFTTAHSTNFLDVNYRLLGTHIKGQYIVST